MPDFCHLQTKRLHRPCGRKTALNKQQFAIAEMRFALNKIFVHIEEETLVSHLTVLLIKVMSQVLSIQKLIPLQSQTYPSPLVNRVAETVKASFLR